MRKFIHFWIVVVSLLSFTVSADSERSFVELKPHSEQVLPSENPDHQLNVVSHEGSDYVKLDGDHILAAPSKPKLSTKERTTQSIDEALELFRKNTEKYVNPSEGRTENVINRVWKPSAKFYKQLTQEPNTEFEEWLARKKLFGKFGIFMKRVFQTFFEVTPKQQWTREIKDTNTFKEVINRFFKGIKEENL